MKSVQLYSKSDLDRIKGQRKTNWIIFGIILFAMVVFSVVMLCMLDRGNKVLFSILVSAIDVLMTFVIIVLLLKNKYLADHQKILATIISSDPIKLNGHIVQVDKEVTTISSSVKVYEIEIEVDRKTQIAYVIDSFMDEQIINGSISQIDMVGRFIKGVYYDEA